MAGPDDRSLPRLRTPAERDALGPATTYARSIGLDAPPERHYLEALPPSRRDIRDRFLAGLCRGRPGSLAAPALVDGDRDGRLRAGDPLPFDAAGGIPTGDADRVALIELSAGSRYLSIPVDSVGAFDRVRPGDPVTIVGPEATTEVRHPVDLVSPLERAGAFTDADQAATVRVELAESVANLALARLAERRLARGAPESILEASATSVPAADHPSYLERLVTRGHPFHPAAKIRRGMSPGDGLAYAPEFAPAVDLRFVAIHTGVARRVSADDGTVTGELFRALDGLEGAAARSVPGDLSAYAVVPVHPWQFHHVVEGRYRSQRRDGRVVPVAEFTWPATPLLNLRTVVPRREPPAPHCKLPIAVRTTNVERTLSPQAVHNGPRTTRLWRAIDDREGFDELGALAERATASYYPAGGPHLEGDAYDDVRNLGALLRENPLDHPMTSGDARPIPAASLVARNPATGEPLVAEAVARFADGEADGAARGPGVRDVTADAGSDPALAFLGSYLEAVVPSQLRLLTAYGVALETHLQNSYVVFEGGRPVGTLARDFGGIRVLDDRLATHGIDFEPYPESDLEADGETDLHWKLYYALFQNHLAELIGALERSAGVDTRVAWGLVARTCRRTFDRLRADATVPDGWVDDDEAALFADPIALKALTAMRMQGKRHEYVTSEVSNPLVGRGSRPTRATIGDRRTDSETDLPD